MNYKKNMEIQKEENVKEEIVEILVAKLGEFSTIDEVAEALNVSRVSICRAIESGKIVALHFGKRVIIVTRTLSNAIETDG